jgi:hypothetical protein
MPRQLVQDSKRPVHRLRFARSMLRPDMVLRAYRDCAKSTCFKDYVQIGEHNVTILVSGLTCVVKAIGPDAERHVQASNNNIISTPLFVV